MISPRVINKYPILLSSSSPTTRPQQLMKVKPLQRQFSTPPAQNTIHLRNWEKLRFYAIYYLYTLSLYSVVVALLYQLLLLIVSRPEETRSFVWRRRIEQQKKDKILFAEMTCSWFSRGYNIVESCIVGRTCLSPGNSPYWCPIILSDSPLASILQRFKYLKLGVAHIENCEQWECADDWYIKR